MSRSLEDSQKHRFSVQGRTIWGFWVWHGFSVQCVEVHHTPPCLASEPVKEFGGGTDPAPTEASPQVKRAYSHNAIAGAGFNIQTAMLVQS